MQCSFSIKNLNHFAKLISLNISKNVLPQHSQKSFSLYRFTSKHVSGFFQKKYLHCTISRRPRIAFLRPLESKCLYIPVNLRKKIFVPEMLEPFIWWGAFIAVWASENVLKFFILIEIFVASTIFQRFDTSINSIETLKFWTSIVRLWLNFASESSLSHI